MVYFWVYHIVLFLNQGLLEGFGRKITSSHFEAAEGIRFGLWLTTRFRSTKPAWLRLVMFTRGTSKRGTKQSDLKMAWKTWCSQKLAGWILIMFILFDPFWSCKRRACLIVPASQAALPGSFPKSVSLLGAAVVVVHRGTDQILFCKFL